MRGLDRVEELAHVIDDHRAGERCQHGDVRRQFAAVELDLHVPADVGDATRERGDPVPGEDSAAQHVGARATHAARVERLQLGHRRVLRDDGDASRARADLQHAVEHAAVVEAVEDRLHGHHALEAEPAHRGAVFVGAAPLRRESRVFARRKRELIAVEMHVAIARAGRRHEVRRGVRDGHRHTERTPLSRTRASLRASKSGDRAAPRPGPSSGRMKPDSIAGIRSTISR